MYNSSNGRQEPPVTVQPTSATVQELTLYPNGSQNADGVVNATTGMWMPDPALGQFGCLENCPPGLHYLAPLDKIIFHEEYVDETLCLFEPPKRFLIKTAYGHNVYLANEEGNACKRDPWKQVGLCANFTMTLTDAHDQAILKFQRGCTCSNFCCCSCCCEQVEISVSDGEIIGYLVPKLGCIEDTYLVSNASREPMLQIKNKYNIWKGNCNCECNGPRFEILTMDGKTKVGELENMNNGFLKQFPLAECGATFPHDLDVRMKAVILGATMYFECVFFYALNARRKIK